MSHRGRRPKPTVIKEAAGNPGRRQLNELEPVVPPGVPAPPEWLSADARKHWFSLAPMLISMRVLTLADAIPFARYCEVLTRYIELKEFIMGKGPTGTTYPIRDGNGKIRCVGELPQAAEFRRLHELLMRLEREFGMTPAARSVIRVEPSTMPTPSVPPGPLLAFFAGGGPKPPRA